ncbi:MAG TPA: hypothetical protein VL418_09540 [Devosiaceae bacterium]|nr:hypothetical protein [Devosiaceae bacterium]
MNEIVYETIAEVASPSVVEVLVAALRGYGFHPLVRDDANGLPGISSLSLRGTPIEVPEAEAADARVLAEALLRDMTK